MLKLPKMKVGDGDKINKKLINDVAEYAIQIGLYPADFEIYKEYFEQMLKKHAEEYGLND